MLHETGFQRPTYDELLTRQITRAKELFGEDIDTSEQAVLGKYIRLNVEEYAELYEDLERIYYARFPNTALGVSLDRLCPFAGLSRNPATYARYQVRFYGAAGTKIDAGFLIQADTGQQFHTVVPSTLSENGTKECIVECDEPGECGNGSIGWEITNPVEYLDRVEPVRMLRLGVEVENDAALRIRFTKTISGAGSGTVDSIIGAVARVPGVTGVHVVENDTYETDSSGRPPKSFEVYVLAPQEQDLAVAEAIFSKKPVGIPCVGNVSVKVLDNGGLPHTIRFSRSTEITVWLKATIHTNSFFETDGEEQIKAHLSEYVFGFENGQNVVLSSLYGYIHKTTGVVETQNLELSTDGITYTTDNVLCNIFQVARLPKENIQLEVL